MSDQWQDHGSRATAANALTAFRLIAAPIMIYLAVAGHSTLFLWLLLASFLSDATDGTVARLSGGPTPFGAKFDSVADAVAYTAITISVFLLWPDLVRQELVAVVVVVASLVFPAAAGLYKFGWLTSYHTRLVKFAVVCVAISLLLMLCDVATWPFRLAAGLAAMAGVEQVIITLLLSEAKSDVHGISAAWRSRQVN